MIKVSVPKGKYIVAVSGGLDSMVLLDLLRRQAGLELVVAHVNHGLRPEASDDAAFVAAVAKSHNIIFQSVKLHLKNASEALARHERYNFLRLCRDKYQADAIITAHHQDDLIETVIINIMRGTGWRGLAPFAEAGEIIRPLLSFTKDDLLGYARHKGLVWKDDSTNQYETYLRNYVRHTIVPWCNQKSATWDKDILRRIRKQQGLRRKIQHVADEYVQNYVQLDDRQAVWARYELIMLPATIAYELLQHVYRKITGNTLERELATASLLFAKTAKQGKVMVLSNQWQIRVTQCEFIVEGRSAVVS